MCLLLQWASPVWFPQVCWRLCPSAKASRSTAHVPAPPGWYFSSPVFCGGQLVSGWADSDCAEAHGLLVGVTRAVWPWWPQREPSLLVVVRANCPGMQLAPTPASAWSQSHSWLLRLCPPGSTAALLASGRAPHAPQWRAEDGEVSLPVEQRQLASQCVPRWTSGARSAKPPRGCPENGRSAARAVRWRRKPAVIPAACLRRAGGEGRGGHRDATRPSCSPSSRLSGGMSCAGGSPGSRVLRSESWPAGVTLPLRMPQRLASQPPRLPSSCEKSGISALIKQINRK